MKRHQTIMAALCLCLSTAFALLSCGNKKDRTADAGMKETVTVKDSAAVITPVYAEGFEIRYVSGGCLVDIRDPQKEKGQGETYHFALVSDKATFDFDALPDRYITLNAPVKRIICMTSLQLSNFLRLGAADRIVGITSTRHLFDKGINERIAQGLISKIGIEGNFDSEVIINKNPDLILISPFKRGGYETLKDVGIPLMPHLGYKEKTPLAQAEWIKFIGLLTGEEKKANSIFDSISREYESLKRLTAGCSDRPVVLSGELHGGNWYAVGGQNFLAQLFRDAGADYFLKYDPNTGGITLDFETVYSRAESADYWRILNSYPGTFSYDALESQDPRYADFKAFRERGIIYCNLKETGYYESAPSHPELLLKDFIKVFHPELLPHHTPVYYKLLK